MRIFRTESEAKEFLIRRIVEQANRVRDPLTGIEHKMLYFSETGWTLPGMMEINAEFERLCDAGAYERKILALATNARADDEAAGGDASADWNAAVARLSQGDHYLLVLINPDLVPRAPVKRPRGDIRRLLLTAFAVVAAGLVLDLLVDAVRHRF